MSLKKKKSLLEFYLVSNFFKDQQFYIIENNIKSINNTISKTYKSHKLVKKAILLNKNRIFNKKEKMKYFLRLLTFSLFINLQKYLLTISKHENVFPSLIKINFLFFRQLSAFLFYIVNFEKIYINFIIRLKLIALK